MVFTGGCDTGQSHAPPVLKPPVLAAPTGETEARPNIEHKKAARKAAKRNEETSANLTKHHHQPHVNINESHDEQTSKSLGRGENNYHSKQSGNFETVLNKLDKNISSASVRNHQQHVNINESRDEQPSESHGRGGNDHPSKRSDNFETVLNKLDKNISSANVHNNHKPIDKTRNSKKESKAPASKAFNLSSAFEEFLRVHNCEPLLESDDDSTFVDSVASGLTTRRKVPDDEQHSDPKTQDDQDDEDDNEHDFDEENKQHHAQQMKIKTSQREFDESALEGHLSTHIPPSPMQIAQHVNERQELEDLVVEKRMLKAQLASTQQQLIDAKLDAFNATTTMHSLQEVNKRLNDELHCTKREKEALEQKLAEVGTAEKSQHNHPVWVQCRNDSDTDDATIQQLRLDLNESHSYIKRLEKERIRERKHYHRLMEGATSNRADLDERMEKTMENNLEMRRKCYVFEQKLNSKKKQVIDLESELTIATEELARKDREYKSLLAQLDHLKRLFHDGEKQIEELDCLQDINNGLNEELASSIKENKRLREELRRLKKYSSYRSHESPAILPRKEEEVSKKHESEEGWDVDCKRQSSRAVIPIEVQNDVFAKALEYLNTVENLEKKSAPRPCQTKVTSSYDKACSRFESLRAEFINGQGKVPGDDDAVSEHSFL